MTFEHSEDLVGDAGTEREVTENPGSVRLRLTECRRLPTSQPGNNLE
jgi:hypothetical protein